MFNRLKFRIFLLMIGVSIPAAALVTFLAYRSYLSAQRVELASLSTVAEILSLHIEEGIAGSKSLMTALAQTASWDEVNQEQCAKILQDILEKDSAQAAIFLYKEQQPFCGVSPSSIIQLSEFLPPQTAFRGFASGLHNLASNRKIIWVGRGFRDGGINFTIYALLDTDFLEKMLRNYEGGNGRFSAVTAGPGIVAASSEQLGIHSKTLSDISWLSSRMTRRSTNGEDYIYVSYPLTSVESNVVVAQPARFLFAASDNQFYLAILTSVLMLFLPLAAIWWGLDRLVLRWLGHYSQVTSAYATGDPSARMRDPSDDMPLEIAHVAGSFNIMADRVASRTAELEEEIKRKQTYVRELHHRVKNILQMIASMLAMEAREAQEGQSIGISRASRRIAALGATYAIFYGYSERGKAPLATVINEAISRLGLGAPVRAVNYEASGDFELNVDLDMSITITMLLAEFISAYLANNKLGSINVNAYIGRVLEVRMDAPFPPQLSSLGDRFVKAYLRQLDATLRENEASLLLKVKLANAS